MSERATEDVVEGRSWTRRPTWWTWVVVVGLGPWAVLMLVAVVVHAIAGSGWTSAFFVLSAVVTGCGLVGTWRLARAPVVLDERSELVVPGALGRLPVRAITAVELRETGWRRGVFITGSARWRIRVSGAADPHGLVHDLRRLAGLGCA